MVKKTFVSLLAVLALAGCGAPAEPKAAQESPKAAETTAAAATEQTPAAMPKRAPRLEGKQANTDASSREFGRHVVRTFYYSLAVRDTEALTGLVGRERDCQGCRDAERMIAKLERQQQIQLPGRVTFDQVTVTARDGRDRILQLRPYVGEGTYLDESTGSTGVLAAQKNATIQVSTTWNAKRKTWMLRDFTLAD